MQVTFSIVRGEKLCVYAGNSCVKTSFCTHKLALKDNFRGKRNFGKVRRKSFRINHELLEVGMPSQA